jgi:hypothetical protein
MDKDSLKDSMVEEPKASDTYYHPSIGRLPPSPSPTIMNDVESAPPRPEERKFNKHFNKDLGIVLVQVFLSELPRGIILPTLIQYITTTGTNNPNFITSLTISAFSVGRLFSAYPLGLLSDSTGNEINMLKF